MGFQKLVQLVFSWIDQVSFLHALERLETDLAEGRVVACDRGSCHHLRGVALGSDCDKDDVGYLDNPLMSVNSKCLRLKAVPKGQKVMVYCKRRGQFVYGDCYWLLATYSSTTGYMSDYWVVCGGKICPTPNC
uniref:Uncharacterized protein n=1 Tax=Physcomitrium patens TaxID=3218 RepID=A0A2K1J106_PHYPA|nr:hypothetical protein PHYPA_023104 [Physcomitrium patens]